MHVVDELGGAVGGKADADREAVGVARRLVEAVSATTLIVYGIQPLPVGVHTAVTPLGTREDEDR